MQFLSDGNLLTIYSFMKKELEPLSHLVVGEVGEICTILLLNRQM